MRYQIWISACLAIGLYACGGGGETESQSDPTAADETTTTGDEAAVSTDEGASGETQSASSGLPPLGEGASEAAHDAEYQREELHRLVLVLETHLDRDDIPCEDATSTQTEICDIAGRICDMDQADTDVAARCEAGNADCEEARNAVAQHCGAGS
jgi:hypothetical protein